MAKECDNYPMFDTEEYNEYDELFEQDDFENMNANEADDYEDDDFTDGERFAQPGGTSALRAATRSNPRNLPCPTCGRPNMLTPKDRSLGYQCDLCADRDEGGGY